MTDTDTQDIKPGQFVEIVAPHAYAGYVGEVIRISDRNGEWPYIVRLSPEYEAGFRRDELLSLLLQQTK